MRFFAASMVTDPLADPLQVALTVDSLKLVAGRLYTKLKPGKVVVPPGVVRDITPDEPEPTTAETLVGEFTVTELAAAPPKLTALASVKLVPVIVTVVPAMAFCGVKDVITGAGGGVMVNVPAT